MPDGLSHLFIGYSTGSLLKKNSAILSLILVGSILPDLAQKPLILFYKKDYFYHLQASHSVFTMAFLCALMALYIKNIEFKKSFGALYIGVLTHFFFDIFQYGLSGGGYRFLIPVYNKPIFYPLFKAHNWYYVLMPAALISFCIFLISYRKNYLSK